MNFFNVTVEKIVLLAKMALLSLFLLVKLRFLKVKVILAKKLSLVFVQKTFQAILLFKTYPNATVTAEVMVSELLGSETMLYVKIGDAEFASRVDARDFHNPGEKVSLTFNVAKGHFFDIETEQAIR